MKRFVLLIALLAGPVWADVVVLKDGTRLEGELKRTAQGWTMTLPDGKTRTFTIDAVQSIQPTAGAAREPAQAAAGLASLRRSVEALSDLDQIIQRYQRFVDTTRDAAVVADAKSDLETWRKRKADGLIKHGSQWVTPAQIAELGIVATARALDARDLMRQNKIREAEGVLQESLQLDPKNPAALYLRGVLLYRQDKLPDARKAFESVTSIVPDHVPSLNNLAIILWKQNQIGGALNFYDQAMLAAGINDYVLNNVAEALGSMPDDLRRGPAYMRAIRRFAEQDQALQQQMAQQGKYRWGATWVDEKKMDELKAAEHEIKKKLDAMQVEFDQANARINTINGEITTNENTMVQLRGNQAFSDGRGNVIVTGPPQAYYDFQRQNQNLAAEQEALKTKVITLNEQAARIRQELPVPRFTGVQQIVGVEGLPGGSASPATQPMR